MYFGNIDCINYKNYQQELTSDRYAFASIPALIFLKIRVFSSFEFSLCHCCIAQLKTAHSCYKEAPSAAKEVSFESEKKKMAPKREVFADLILPIGAKQKC